MHNTFNFKKDTSESSMRRTLKRAGYDEKRIDSYLRGWFKVKAGDPYGIRK